MQTGSVNVRGLRLAALAVAFATSCSQPSRHEPSGASNVTAPTKVTSSTPPRPDDSRATTTVTVAPALYSFAPQPAPPPLPKSTDDPRAAVVQLIVYQDWLYSHHPDPTLVDNIYVPNNPSWSDVQRDVTWLRDHQRRLYDRNAQYAVIRNEPVGDSPRLFVRNQATQANIVEADGSVYEIWRTPKGTEFAALLARQSGVWKFVAVTPIGHRPLLKERP